MLVRSGHIFACIDNSPPEEHGDKHALPGPQLRHLRLLKKRTEGFIREDSAIEGLGSGPDSSLAADEIIKFIDHLILTIQENGSDASAKGG